VYSQQQQQQRLRTAAAAAAGACFPAPLLGLFDQQALCNTEQGNVLPIPCLANVVTVQSGVSLHGIMAHDVRMTVLHACCHLLLLLLQLCPEAGSVPVWLRPLEPWTVLQSENTVSRQAAGTYGWKQRAHVALKTASQAAGTYGLILLRGGGNTACFPTKLFL
jgi:hypothetical protein